MQKTPRKGPWSGQASVLLIQVPEYFPILKFAPASLRWLGVSASASGMATGTPGWKPSTGVTVETWSRLPQHSTMEMMETTKTPTATCLAGGTKTRYVEATGG